MTSQHDDRLAWAPPTLQTPVCSYERGVLDNEVSCVVNVPLVGGRYGDFYLGRHQTFGRVTLKRLKYIANDETTSQKILEEVDSLRRISHKNILPFLGLFQDGPNLYTISPYMKNGSLKQWVEEGRSLDRATALYQLADAVAHLHSLSIVHGDIKAQNVLLSDDRSPLLCDFGLSQTLRSMVTFTDAGGRTSTRWMAPELFNNRPKSKESDVYAFGMTIAEVLTGKPPLHHINEYLVPVQVLVMHSKPLRPKGFEDQRYNALWDAAEKCWAPEPFARPHATQIFTLDSDTPHPSPSPSEVVPAGALSVVKSKAEHPRQVGSTQSDLSWPEKDSSTRPIIKPSPPISREPLPAKSTTASLSGLAALISYLCDHAPHLKVATIILDSIASTLLFFLGLINLSTIWRSFLQQIRPPLTPHQPLDNFKAQPPGDVTPQLPDYTGPQVHDITKSISHIQGEPIGCGGSCDVYLAFHRDHGRVAMKRPRTTYYDASELRRFHREATLWCNISHPNILPFLGTCMVGQRIHMVSPFIKNGDLFKCIRNGMELDKRKILLQLADAVAYLHALGIVHGDIKAQNVMLSDDKRPLLCDFGLAKVLCTMATSADCKGRGSTRWMAPELFNNEPKTKESDVYAFGMTMAEVLSGKVPLAHIYDHAVVAQVLVYDARPLCEPLEAPDASLAGLWEVAKACWTKNPKDRPTMTQVLPMFD